MPVSGLVLTLDADPDARASVLRALGNDARITLGDGHGAKLPAVTETTSAEESEELVERLFELPGILFVDVVCIDTSLDLEPDEIAADAMSADSAQKTPRSPHE